MDRSFRKGERRLKRNSLGGKHPVNSPRRPASTVKAHFSVAEVLGDELYFAGAVLIF
jgi:hypothetical protein